MHLVRTSLLAASLAAGGLVSAAVTTPAGASGAGAASAEVPSPAHWWRADGTAKDAVGTDDGTLVRAGYGPGVYGDDQAFSFAGRQAHVRFDMVGGNLGRHDFTFTFSIKTNSRRKQAIWNKRPICDAASFWDFRMSEEGLVQPELMSDRAAHDYTAGFSSTSRVNDGAWHAIALSRAGTTALLYFDGRLEDTATTPRPVNLDNHVPMRSGVDPCVGVDGTYPFTGQLDELRIYRSGLTQAQIQALIPG